MEGILHLPCRVVLRLEKGIEVPERTLNNIAFYLCEPHLKKYLPQTSIIHLHGIENGVDHLGIDKLSAKMIDLIFSKLQGFTGTLSVEVFSFGDLKNSLEVLEQRWKKE